MINWSHNAFSLTLLWRELPTGDGLRLIIHPADEPFVITLLGIKRGLPAKSGSVVFKRQMSASECGRLSGMSGRPAMKSPWQAA